MQSSTVRNWSIGVFILALALVPLFTTDMYTVFVLNNICINVMLVLALNFILGFAGQVFMGTVAFFAIASYTSALLFVYCGFRFWQALPFAIFTSALCSLIIGIPTLRISGAYLALMSMGFIIVVTDILRNWMSLTKGVWGVPDIPRPTFWGIDFTDNLNMFYLALAFVAVLSGIAVLIEDSRFGLAFKAVRDDQLATELSGLNSTRVKVMAFVLCGIYTGVAGAFFASFHTFISPDIYTFEYNSIFMCMLVVGGLSTVPGAILGGSILTVAIELLRPLKEKYVTVFALFIILILLYEPGGLMVVIERVVRWFRKARDGNGGPTATTGRQSGQPPAIVSTDGALGMPAGGEERHG
ncbi:MAG: branched-chain amino acid ABC transporter permease [Planctomycetes bacterium]|nr:branched-chain amino acid ABC transporter permease [Planctomycetota bacterium]